MRRREALLALVVLPLTAVRAGATEGLPAWDYEGELGPRRWSGLDPAYSACGLGKRQSPIDLPRTAPTAGRPFDVRYRPSHVVVENNGHTVEARVEPGRTLTLDGTTYGLVQFHFHAPSEHMIGGSRFPMELHLVHKTADGKRIAVVGVLIAAGARNAALAELLVRMPATAGVERELRGRLDPAALLPGRGPAYRYTGSLTTPPCTEGVRWTVLAQPLQLSRVQIARFTRLYDHDNRPLQPLNGRAVVVG
jgi:carbonic anhydrase